jgi:hypothetical protein
MPTDLPTAIRDALHADEITAADLRQPVLRDRPRGGPRVSPVLAATVSAFAVLAIAVTVSLVASGQPQGDRSAASGHGTIRGRLLAVGGPAGIPNRALPGTVTLTNTRTHLHQSVPVGADGRYSVPVTPGRYTIDGRSPKYGSGRYACHAPQPVQITTGTTVHADVICEEN